MNEEPFGHRGHPSDHEGRRSRRLVIYIERAIHILTNEGFTSEEALAFIAGIAFEKAAERGETWAAPDTARRTVINLLEGRSAKEWSIEAIILALWEIGGLTQR